MGEAEQLISVLGEDIHSPPDHLPLFCLLSGFMTCTTCHCLDVAGMIAVLIFKTQVCKYTLAIHRKFTATFLKLTDLSAFAPSIIISNILKMFYKAQTSKPRHFISKSFQIK